MTSIARSITQWKKNDITAALKKSRRVWHDQYLTIRVSKSRHTLGKILVITPRKMGKANTRNLFRRRIKALFYQEKLYENSYDWIVIGKPKGTELCFHDLKDIFLSVNNMLKK